MGSGPETRLVAKMRKAGAAKYGRRFVSIKYHGNAFSEAGVSDLLGTLDGVFWACEVKAPESYGGSEQRALDEGPTVKQRAFLDRVNAAGGEATVAASVPGFMAFLETVERRTQDG